MSVKPTEQIHQSGASQLSSRLIPITIIGGGLAGLTLGIGLRQRSVPVLIWETGDYPRHRVCGEFISGRGQETLRRLELLELVFAAGARKANTTAFFGPSKSLGVRTLPQPALCLSRFTLDALLAERFRDLGGELHSGARGPQSEFDQGTVRASGRRAQTAPTGWRWFGVKAHIHDFELTADLEMHFNGKGYVGLCRLPEGKTNICGLFRHRSGEADPPCTIAERLRGAPGAILYERLQTAHFDENSFCAVGGLGLGARRAASCKECCIGDALTMIPPVTGNGMSMAFESAELALNPLLAYARREIPWEACQRFVAKACDKAFASRLRWAQRLQGMLMCPKLQQHLLPIVWKWDACWNFFFWATR